MTIALHVHTNVWDRSALNISFIVKKMFFPGITCSKLTASYTENETEKGEKAEKNEEKEKN